MSTAKLPEPMLQTMQIGMCASPWHSSGTDRYYQELLRYLPHYGVGVRGMVLGEPEKLDEPMPGVEAFGLEEWGRLARIRGARRVAARLIPGTKLIVSHGAAHASYVLDKFGKRPLAVHFHGPWALEGKEEGVGRVLEFVRRFQENAVYRRARRFIALSRAFATTLENEYGVPNENIRIIPGGVDLRRFHLGESMSAARAALGWPQDRPIVLTTRRLEPTKGIGAFLESMLAVRAAIPNVLAIITGNGSLKESLRARSAKLGLQESVRFVGHVAGDRLPVIYRAADVSIAPSLAWEGFGLSVAESLACGTPTLVTPIGGLPEVVSGLSQGLVFEDTSVRSLSLGIIRFFEKREAMPSPEACGSYAQRFAWEHIARQVAGVYREIA